MCVCLSSYLYNFNFYSRETNSRINQTAATHKAYCQLRAQNGPYHYSTSTAIAPSVLNGTLLNSINALLVLTRWYYCAVFKPINTKSCSERVYYLMSSSANTIRNFMTCSWNVLLFPCRSISLSDSCLVSLQTIKPDVDNFMCRCHGISGVGLSLQILWQSFVSIPGLQRAACAPSPRRSASHGQGY